MIALLRADHNTSVMDIPPDDYEDSLFDPDDIDVNKTQEMMISGCSRDPILTSLFFLSSYRNNIVYIVINLIL